MKTFETPVVEVKKFYVEDILTASSGGNTCGQDNPNCFQDFSTCPSDDCPLNTEGPPI